MTGRARIEEIGLAFSLLTRLPLPRFEIRTGATLATAFWAYPIAGAAVATISAVALLATWAATGAPLLSALVALSVSFLATGGFHEDGLADFWDGLGGGATPEARLEIMRDSRLGTYGALALFVALAGKLVLLADLLEAAGPGAAALAMIAAGALARGAIALPFAGLPPAREVGLAAQAKRPPGPSLAVGIVLPCVLAVLLTGAPGVAAIAAAAAGAGIVGWLAGRHLGGYSGDVLGAAALTAEILALAALAELS